jgi:hypothetical protein
MEDDTLKQLTIEEILQRIILLPIGGLSVEKLLFEREIKRRLQLASSASLLFECTKCDGEGWVWWNELDEYNGPGVDTGSDDTRYACDWCNGSGLQSPVGYK